MNDIITANAVLTMSSREIAELTGSTHDNVLKTVRSLVEKGVISGNETPYVHPQNRQTYAEFLLSYRDTIVVVSGYSVELRARIIDRWQELERSVAKPAAALSPAQMFLQTAQLMADLEARQFAQAEAVARVEQRVEQIEQTHVLDARPSNTEGITRIRERIGNDYGLSAKIITDFMYQSPYAPKIAAVVRNTREEAKGATYPVWHVKDVTAVFKRVIAEATQVTDAQYMHPYIEGRFKMRGRKPAKVVNPDADLFEPESSP